MKEILDRDCIFATKVKDQVFLYNHPITDWFLIRFNQHYLNEDALVNATSPKTLSLCKKQLLLFCADMRFS